MSREDSESISSGRCYVEAGEYWDSHDLGEIWERTEEVKIDVDLRSEKFYYSEDIDRLREILDQRKETE